MRTSPRQPFAAPTVHAVRSAALFQPRIGSAT